MARDRGFIAESNVSEILRKPVSQAASSKSKVQRMVARQGNAINDVARSANGVSDIIGTMMDACKYGGVGEVEASAAVWAETGKEARFGGGVYEETVDKKVK